jgi:hypothetical protein
MKIRFAPLLLAVAFAVQPAQASNLNSTANLVNEDLQTDTVLHPAKMVLDGIPLMPGLEIPSDKDLIDILPDHNSKNAAVAVGILDVDDIYNFYKREMPRLGWKATGSRDYARNGEALHINAQAGDKSSTVTFTEKTGQ